MRWATLVVALVAVGIGAAGGVFGQWAYTEHQLARQRAAAAETRAELAGLGERLARPFFGEMLHDPQSLQFRAVRVHGLSICGEYHARNRNGGYVGFRRFILAPTGELSTFETQADYEERYPYSYSRATMIRQLVELQDGLWLASCEGPLESPAELNASLARFRGAVARARPAASPLSGQRPAPA